MASVFLCNKNMDKRHKKGMTDLFSPSAQYKITIIFYSYLTAYFQQFQMERKTLKFSAYPPQYLRLLVFFLVFLIMFHFAFDPHFHTYL